MTTGRLEAFSDGVIAIIITIMVLEMKVPHGSRLEDLAPLLPVFLSYVLSFVYVGIYWMLPTAGARMSTPVESTNCLASSGVVRLPNSFRGAS